MFRISAWGVITTHVLNKKIVEENTMLHSDEINIQEKEFLRIIFFLFPRYSFYSNIFLVILIVIYLIISDSAHENE